MSLQPPQDNAGRKRLLLILGLVISAFCIWLICRQINVAELRHALLQFKWPYLGLGVASLAVGYFMGIQRWAWMLRACGADVTASMCAAPFLGSIALNNVLAFRTGDIVRALVFPDAIGVRRTLATASLLLERIIDVITLLLCVGIGLALSPELSLPDWLKQSVATLSILGGLSIAVLVIFSKPIARIIAHLAAAAQQRGHARLAKLLGLAQQLMNDIGMMSRPSVLLGAMFISLFAWGFEAGLFYAFLAGFALKATIAAALLTMGIATLSTLVPSSPGYVGPFHLAAFAAITMLGGTPAQAASFALLAHAGLWIPTTLAGGIAILMNPQLFKRVGAHAAPSVNP